MPTPILTPRSEYRTAEGYLASSLVNGTDLAHDTGARKFGGRWIDANLETIKLANRAGLDVTRHKEMLSLITLCAMEVATKNGA